MTMSTTDESTVTLVTGDVGLVEPAGHDDRPVGRWRGFVRGFGVVPTIALVVVVLVVLVGLLAPVLSPFDPLAQALDHRLEGISAAHWFGTDVDGRDVLSRLIWGSRSALEGLVVMTGVTALIGIPWGLLSGFLGGAADSVLMRLADVWLAFPGIVLAIALTGVLGPSLFHSMLSVGLVFAPIIARLVRIGVLNVRRREYVLVSRSLGISRVRCALTHILPNAFGPALVQIWVNLSIGLIVEAALSFLGLGVQPPAPSWGGILADAYQQFVSVPLETVAPGLTIFVTAFALAQVGDGLRRGIRRA
jgi:peptide/nickel transport system permease protein